MMEANMERKSVKKEMKIESTCGETNISEEKINKESSDADDMLSIGSISRDNSSLSEKEHDEEDELKSTKKEMGDIRQENESLKIELSKMRQNYESLKTHFLHIVKQETPIKSGDTADPTQQQEEDLVSLTLGRHIIAHMPPKKNIRKTDNFNEEKNQDDEFNPGLKLGLDCRFESSSGEPTMNDGRGRDNEAEEQKQEEVNKGLKRNGEDGVLHMAQLKRARVSVRARCDTPTMNDGCQWRKYGQKIAKGNPCPRAYYRCTISPTCPVRKQAQRCSNDMSILITTYEGDHNHPLPHSATAMASTTSAAASMLKSGSSSSTSQQNYESPVTTSGATSSHSSKMLPHNLFNFAYSSISTLNSHPTITLDLTTTQHQQQQPISQNFNRYSSPLPKYPSTCLNFASSSTTSCLESFSTKPWGNSYLSYDTPSYNRSNEVPSQVQFYQANHMQTSNRNRFQMIPTLTENTLAAATKAAISSDPTFRSAIEAAITSLVSNNAGVGNSSQNMKWGYP